jgi:hypothetical protein
LRYLGVEQIAIELDHIYCGIIEANSVGSLRIKLTDVVLEGVIVTALHSESVETFIVIDPQCNIPSLVVFPPIVGSVEGIALVGCGSHCLPLVDVLIIGTRCAVLGAHCATLPTVLGPGSVVRLYYLPLHSAHAIAANANTPMVIARRIQK